MHPRRYEPKNMSRLIFGSADFWDADFGWRSVSALRLAEASAMHPPC